MTASSVEPAPTAFTLESGVTGLTGHPSTHRESQSTPEAAGSRLGQLIIFTGPSGVGKGTLLRALLQRHPSLELSVSATTRQPRPGEIHGQHYYFLTPEEFRRRQAQGDFLESAEFAGNCYGTLKSEVLERIQMGRTVILEIELEGARQVHEKFPAALAVFILPPSLETLEQRLRLRDQDSEAAIGRRLARAQVEITAAPEFDVQIVNDDLEAALQQLETALLSQPTALQSPC